MSYRTGPLALCFCTVSPSDMSPKLPWIDKTFRDNYNLRSTRNEPIQFTSSLAQEQSLPVVVQSANDRVQQSLGNLCQFFSRFHQRPDISKLSCEIHTEGVHELVVGVGFDPNLVDFVAALAGQVEVSSHHLYDGGGRASRPNSGRCSSHGWRVRKKADGGLNLKAGSEESQYETIRSRRHDSFGVETSLC
jgi:hypothetical protein